MRLKSIFKGFYNIRRTIFGFNQKNKMIYVVLTFHCAASFLAQNSKTEGLGVSKAKASNTYFVSDYNLGEACECDISAN